jgi:hypothetical protein
VLGATPAFLRGGETTYEWRDEPPPGSSIERLEGSLARNVFRIGGLSLQARFSDGFRLSLQARFSDGFRLSWIGAPSFVPVDADAVRRTPRMSTDELLRRHGGQQPGVAPGLPAPGYFFSTVSSTKRTSVANW